MKQTFLYTLLVVCLLSACQTDDEAMTGASDKSEMLSLTVSANDFAVTGETSTRAADNGKTTTFENGDRVGLIVLDEDDNIIADNLPYKFDGSNWNFDSDNSGSKQPAFYAPSMYTYIVYYPYDADANGITSVEALKNLEVFKPQTDQSAENAYRKSDLMVWSSSEGPMKQITATLEHVRNSFSFAPAIQWTLTTNDVIRYPSPTVSENVFIYDKEDKQLFPYRAEDGSYRYILPDGYNGNLRWYYTYNGTNYGGQRTVSTSSTGGTRYAQVETVETNGTYSLDQAAEGDFYCSKETDGGNIGYVVPKDAVTVLDQHRCIGIVFHVGKHDRDNSDYTEGLTPNGPKLSDGQVHGYVVALTDVDDNGLRWEWGPADQYNERVGTSTSRDDWDGYSNSQKFHEFVEQHSGDGWEMKHFPAALACETYGNRTFDQDGNAADGKYDWQKPLAAPVNTSGWFFPSYAQLGNVRDKRSSLSERINHVKNNLPNGCSYGDHIRAFGDWYCWSSTEDSQGGAWFVYFGSSGSGGARIKVYALRVRAVLAF